MKIQKYIYILASILLFKYTNQIENNPVIDNNSFKLKVSYYNGKYYIPMSLKDTINVKIESKSENLNNYYFKYYYMPDNENNNVLIYEDKYFNESNKTMVIPEAKYIIVEMRHKINNNKIILKSENINYDKQFTFNKTYHIFHNENGVIKNFQEKNEYTNREIKLIFYSTFIFASLGSIILTFIDKKDDENFVRINSLSKKDRAKEEYQSLKYTSINKNVISFSFFLMKYTYPILNIFTIYNYNHARYVRLLIELIKILLNYLISFFCFDNFSQENEGKKNYLSLFFFSLLASFIIYILTELITRKILGFDKKRRDIWKPKFESIRKYIFYTVKKDILFNSKWHLIRNRMILYTRICGKSILKNKPENKYKIYADNKTRYNNTKLNELKLANNSITLSKSEDEKDIDSFTEKFMSKTFSLQTKNKNSLLNQRKKTYIGKINKNTYNMNLYIEKGVESFTFSKLGQNNLRLKTVQRIEDIRNRYILNTNEIKFDETLEVNSSIKTYKNLEIESMDNYTYISTDSIKNLSRHNSTSEFYKIIINISITFILLFLLALVDLGLALLYISSSKKYSILTVALQVIIFNLFVNYIFSLFVSVFIFNCYGIEKKNFFNKLIFKLFVEKYIKYIYRIRLLMNKYSKELDFID